MSHLPTVGLNVWITEVLFRKSFPVPTSWRVSPTFSCIKFKALGLTWLSFFQFKLNFVQHEREVYIDYIYFLFTFTLSPLILMEMLWGFTQLNMVFAVGLLYIAFIILKYGTWISRFFRNFIMMVTRKFWKFCQSLFCPWFYSCDELQLLIYMC